MTKMQALIKLNVWNQYLSNTLADNHTREEAMRDTFGLATSFNWSSTPEGHTFWSQTSSSIRKLKKDSL